MSATAYKHAMRFGHGPGPDGTAVAPDAMLARLTGPDTDAERFPQTPESEVHGALRAVLRARRMFRDDASEENREAFRAATRVLAAQYDAAQRVLLARAAFGADGLRDRLTLFWFDHFTVSIPDRRWRAMVPAYIETAIRPHVTGRFAELLRAAAFHPAMLHYLDQSQSVGPNSRFGQRTGRGLNENLAREILELHTLGVGGGYGQGDVRELAELLTGVGINGEGFRFNANLAEPGAETVLGRSYGGGGPPSGRYRGRTG